MFGKPDSEYPLSTVISWLEALISDEQEKPKYSQVHLARAEEALQLLNEIEEN